MKIEKAILLKALKAGDTVWDKGTIFPEKDGAPIPEDILVEIRKQTGTVKVLKQGRDIKAKPAPVAKEKLKQATTTTTIKVEKEEKPKPKVKLKLRKKK